MTKEDQDKIAEAMAVLTEAAFRIGYDVEMVKMRRAVTTEQHHIMTPAAEVTLQVTEPTRQKRGD